MFSQGTPAFGSFGGSTPQNNLFGQQGQQPTSWLTQSKPAFGSSFGTPATTTSIFGSNSLNSTTSVFGTSFSNTNVNQTQAGTPIPFKAVAGNDTMMKNNVNTNISTLFQCITVMSNYENKSLEELRLEDYQLNRKGKVSSGFGGIQPLQSTSIFSATNTTTGSFAKPTNTFAFSSLNQTKPPPSFLSNTQPTAFGGGTQSTFGSFGSQPSTLFSGTNTNTISTTNTFGNSSFNFNVKRNQPSVLGGNIFGQQTITPTTTPAFGTLNSGFAKPSGLFGTQTTQSSFFATPAPFNSGTGGIFGGQQQKPSFFGTQPQTTSNLGGAAPSFTFKATPTSNVGPAFGTSTTPIFGGTGTGSTNFGSFGNQQGFATGIATSNSGFGTFSSVSTPTPAMGFSCNQCKTFPQYLQAPPNQHSLAMIPFATTPFKDSPLFYNLIVNRNIDELSKPTNPIAQKALKEASKRKQSISFNTTGSSNVKNFISPVPRSQVFATTKQSIFDGFEEDLASSIDILLPKSECKKLSINAVRFCEKSRLRKPFSFTRDGQSDISLTVHSTSFDPNGSLVDVKNNFDENTSVPSYQDFVRESKSKNCIKESCKSVGDHGDGCDLDDKSSDNSSNVDATVLDGCNLKCTRPGYYVHPTIEDLNLKTDEMGDCFIRGFIIGRHNYGKIQFLEVVNVAGIDIDEEVFFRHKELVVYPDDDAKPPVGLGLNCPAEVILERVWPIDKTTQEPIKSSEKLRELNYESKLRRACNRQDAEFISYHEESGAWTFRVKHF